MKTVLETTQDIINICTNSTYIQREGKLDYYYVYIHYINDIPVYIGQGSHNRAYKYTGRSNKWYEICDNKTVVIRIIKDKLTYQESIRLEKELIEYNSNTLINEDYGHSPNESFPVLCFTRKGVLVKRYNSSEETVIDGFSAGAVRVNCNQNQGRSTYKGYVWCYEKDYEEIKHYIFELGITCSKSIEVTFPDGIVKTYKAMNHAREDGLQPSKIAEVIDGRRKSHKGCSFRYID